MNFFFRNAFSLFFFLCNGGRNEGGHFSLNRGAFINDECVGIKT